MYYTNKIENNKLGSYTDNPALALELGFDIVIEKIQFGADGFVYIDGCAPQPQKTDYVQMRVAEYPDIAEQLDMIYWDKINGTNTWIDTIATIKEKYPKE